MGEVRCPHCKQPILPEHNVRPIYPVPMDPPRPYYHADCWEVCTVKEVDAETFDRKWNA